MLLYNYSLLLCCYLKNLFKRNSLTLETLFYETIGELLMILSDIIYSEFTSNFIKNK